MLSNLLNIAVIVFAVWSMFSVGLMYTLRQIIEPLRDLRLVALGLLANFILVPAWAVSLTRLFAMEEPYAIGLLVVASAAGAPFLVKLVQLSDGRASRCRRIYEIRLEGTE